jgi:hypothetical protein
LSCRPPVIVPGPVGRAPPSRPEITDRAPPAAGRWKPGQAERLADGQLQCLVRRAALPQAAPRGDAREPDPELPSPGPPGLSKLGRKPAAGPRAA